MKNTSIIIFLLCSINLQSQIGWVGNMFPSGTSNTANTGTGYDVFIDVWKDGVTNMAGQGAGIDCYLHYGLVSAFGGTWSNVTTLTMSYHGDSGNNDVYTYDLDVSPGLYEYTCYCDDGNGQVWQGDANGGVTFTAILPVFYRSLKLDSNKEVYNLSWETASEINNDFFRIWVSQDGHSWKAYKDIDSHFERSNHYTTSLDFPWKDLYVYLEQYDINGASSRSKILFSKKEGSTPIVYPNPFNDQLKIQGENFNSWTIQNIEGHNILSGKFDDSQIIDTKTLAHGYYILIIDHVEGKHVSQIVK